MVCRSATPVSSHLCLIRHEQVVRLPQSYLSLAPPPPSSPPLSVAEGHVVAFLLATSVTLRLRRALLPGSLSLSAARRVSDRMCESEGQSMFEWMKISTAWRPAHKMPRPSVVCVRNGTAVGALPSPASCCHHSILRAAEEKSARQTPPGQAFFSTSPSAHTGTSR